MSDNLRLFISSLEDPDAQDPADPSAQATAAPVTLTDPNAQADPDAQLKNLPPVPQLKRLSPDEAAKCEQWLVDNKFAPLLIPGKKGTEPDDYQPGLGGLATGLLDIVHALGPLTVLNPSDELYALVSNRYDALLRQAVQARAANLNVPPGGPGTDPPPEFPKKFWETMPKRDDTPEWKKWQDAVKDWCEEHHVDPGPILDMAKDKLSTDPRQDLGVDPPKEKSDLPKGDPDSPTKTGPTTTKPPAADDSAADDSAAPPPDPPKADD